MTAKEPWFTVDRAGLAKIVAHDSVALIHPELFG